MGSSARIPFLDLSVQTHQVASSYCLQLRQLVDKNCFVGGEPVEGFEKAFARFCGTRHCVALNSGTDALRLGLLGAGLEPDHEVITSPFTFIATAEAISQTCVLKLADVDPDTFTLSPAAVEENLSPQLKAIVPVHIFGLPADMRAFDRLASQHDLFVMEDACQAHGASVEGRRAGSLGTAAGFSFYPSKNLGAFGDAGAVTCQRQDLAERLRLLRNHGQVGSYIHEVEGFNSRMDAFQGAALALKLNHLEEWNQQRRHLAEIYRNELRDLPEVRLQTVPSGHVHVYHVFAILAEDRSGLQEFLGGVGIETRVIYPVPIHLHLAYRHLGLEKGDFPNAESICSSVLCLPIYPGLEPSQASEVARQVRRFYGQG